MSRRLFYSGFVITIRVLDDTAQLRADRSRRRSSRVMKKFGRPSKIPATNLSALKITAPRAPGESPACQYCQGNCDGGCF